MFGLDGMPEQNVHFLLVLTIYYDPGREYRHDNQGY